jgi:hypothetical protein
MPRIRRYTYAFVLACALAAGPAASAGWADHGEPYASETFTDYLEVAEAHWGRPAPTCPGPDGVPIPVHAGLYDDPDPDVSARAEVGGCRIWLDRSFWPAAPREIDCTIITHEWGHLLGFVHSDDPQSLMFEAPLTGAPGCEVFGGPALAPAVAGGRRRLATAVTKRSRRAAARRCAKARRSLRKGAKHRRTACMRLIPGRSASRAFQSD